MVGMLNTDGGEYAFMFTPLAGKAGELFAIQYNLQRHNTDVTGIQLNDISCAQRYETITFDTDRRNGHYMTLSTMKDPVTGKSKTLKAHEKETGKYRANARFILKVTPQTEATAELLAGASWSSSRELTLGTQSPTDTTTGRRRQTKHA